ncbi:unnamed protein product [Rotaria sp. Silwood1]|nr:unnamed protein product [Rotaria sp. Silwood1]
MPRGQHYSQETKELMFNVIKFIESEKNGAIIPLYNANDRIMAALQISHGSLVNLKNELKQLEEEEQKILEQQLLEQQQQQRPYILAQKYKNERLRRRSLSPYTIPTTDRSRTMNTPHPAAKSPAKRGGPTSFKVSLSEYEEDLIRPFSDETWINSGEEKRAVWVNEHGQGRIRITEGKGNARSITIIIDNASWHRELTDDTKPPQRSWRKQRIANWLQNHNILYADDISKAELLQLAYENLPKRKYKVDEEAKRYRINILRLPIRHCTLNPVELAWANMKTYIRDRNTKFTLVEATFKKADMFAEKIEEELNDDDNEDERSVYSADTGDDNDDE